MNTDNQQQQQQPNNQEVAFPETSTSGILNIPSGYRFRPTDEELILFYLRPKIADLPLPANLIPTLDINTHCPESIREAYKWIPFFKEDNMYFFTTRIRKYANGTRPNRIVKNGYWKLSGKEKSITFNNQIIGYKKYLNFYTINRERSSWKMHEYRINRDGSAPRKKADGTVDMQLDKYVLCKVYKCSRKKQGQDDHEEEDDEEDIDRDTSK